MNLFSLVFLVLIFVSFVTNVYSAIKQNESLGQNSSAIEKVKRSLNKDVLDKKQILLKLKNMNREIEEHENLRLEVREAIQGSEIKMLRSRENIIQIAKDIQELKDTLRRNIALLVSEQRNTEGAAIYLFEDDVGERDGSIEATLSRQVKSQSAVMKTLEKKLLAKIELEKKYEEQKIYAEKLSVELRSREKILKNKIRVQEKLLSKTKQRTASRVRALRSLKADERDISMVLNHELQMAKDNQAQGSVKGWSRKWMPSPLKGSIVGRFGKKTDSLLGITMISKGMRIRPIFPGGSPVKAIAEGRVVFAGKFRSYGNMVIVEYHRKGKKIPEFYLIGGLAELLVKKGDQVVTSQKLGSAGKEVYLEMREGKKAVNPLSKIKFI